MANTPLARDFLYEATLPTLIGSVRELKSLVAIGQYQSAADVLKQITEDPEMRTSMLGSALHRFRDDR